MSAGELLREELKKENENSKLISSYIKDGKIVPVLFVDPWLKERNNSKFVKNAMKNKGWRIIFLYYFNRAKIFW